MYSFVKDQKSPDSEKLHTILLGWCHWIKWVFSWIRIQVWGEERGGIQVLLSGVLLLNYHQSPSLATQPFPPLSLSSCIISQSPSTIAPFPSFLLPPEIEGWQLPIKVERTMTITYFSPHSQAQSWEKMQVTMTTSQHPYLPEILFVSSFNYLDFTTWLMPSWSGIFLNILRVAIKIQNILFVLRLQLHLNITVIAKMYNKIYQVKKILHTSCHGSGFPVLKFNIVLEFQ